MLRSPDVILNKKGIDKEESPEASWLKSVGPIVLMLTSSTFLIPRTFKQRAQQVEVSRRCPGTNTRSLLFMAATASPAVW